MPGGPFNDLLLLSPTNLPFGFADAAGGAAQAAGVVADFVLAYAPLLTITPELANQLSVYLFALAIDTVVNSIPLGDQNRINHPWSRPAPRALLHQLQLVAPTQRRLL